MTGDADQALLLACLHQDATRLDPAALPGPDSPRWDALVALAAAQRVRVLLARRLRGLRPAGAVPPRILEGLDQYTRAITLRNLRSQAEIAGIAGALHGLGVDLLLLKGAHLVTGVYDQVGLREMSDVDLMVRRDRLADAVAVLAARGYTPLRDFSIELDTALHHHLPKFVKPDVAGIELHWTLAVPTSAHDIDPTPLWRRAQPLSVGGARAFGLSLEDLLLHLCHHTSYSHQFRFGLRPFCDVATVAARRDAPIDWEVLAARAREWSWNRGVYLSLRLAQEMIGAAIPSHALAALQPDGFEQAIVSVARAQVFEAGDAPRLAPGVARLAGRDAFAERLRHLAGRLAPPRREVARLYGLSETSPGLALAYPRRLWDLARRHARPTLRLLLTREGHLTEYVGRTDTIRRWLSGDQRLS